MADARPSMPLGRLLSTGDDLLDFWQLRAHFETIEGATYTEHHRLFSDSSRQIRNQLEIKRWKRERELGRGGFGTVYFEQETEGQLRAVKIVQRRSEKKAVEYLREVLAMANLSRDNGYFIQLYGWYADERNIYIAMEHVPHRDLQHCVQKALPEDEVRTIILQVVEALEVLHERDWAHRDLKPSNVFVINTGPSWWVKLGDLGVSKRVRDDMTQYQTSIRNNFEAPEMIGIPGVGDDEHYTNAVDIWALGYLMYWLLTLELPFPNNKQLFLYCMQEPTPPLPQHHLAQRSTTDKAIEFLSQLLRPQPETRSTARELLAQTWLRNPTPDESVISDKAFQQYRTASSGKVIERPRPYSPRRGSPVRDDVHVQTERDEVEASEEGTTTTTEKRISQITQIPISYVNGETAQDASSKEIIATYANADGMLKLTVTIVRADGLYKRDIFRFPDPFAVLTINDAQTKTTSVIKKTLNPYWNEVFEMRATEDSILCVQIFDYKYFKKKDQRFLGVTTFRVGDKIDLDIGGDEMVTRDLKKSSDDVPVHGKLLINLSTPIPEGPPTLPLTGDALLKGLPRGWEARIDDNGRTYYVDHNTKSTAWVPPPPLKQGGPANGLNPRYSDQPTTIFR